MAGHDVVRSVDKVGGGADDAAYHIADFKLSPRGIDMNGSDIVRAFANVTATYPSGIASEMVVLNGYRW